ncbi:MAG: hypothetical protein HQK52_10525 [Oligoflexia bacterium]|nr:hypothetical protein [Oligoflexia bacterium]
MASEKDLFVEKIIQTLQANGFPEKKVTLPLEKMYEISESKKLNFNDVLTELAAQGINHEKLSDKILFSQVEQNNQDIHQKIFDRLKGMDPKDMMKNAQSILSSMSPEELQAMQEMYQSMTPSQREELAKRAQEMNP